MLNPRYLPLAGLLLVTGSVSALAQERQIGLKVGASVATLERERSQVGDDSFGTRAGLTAGAFGVFPLRDRVSLQLETLFTEKGGSLPLRDPRIIQGSLTTRYMLHYLDVPTLLRMRGPRIGAAGLHALAGPTVSVRLSAKQQTVYELPAPAGFERDLGGEMRRFDLGFTVGGGAEIGRGVIDARYSWGFAQVVTDTGGAALSNRGFLITAGVRVF